MKFTTSFVKKWFFFKNLVFIIDSFNHQIIKSNFKVKNGSSHSEHVKIIREELDKIFSNFYKGNYNLILVSHGNSIGIILKYFLNIKFTFDNWKKITMPDMYSLDFDDQNKVIDFKRDVGGIEKIFSI